MQTRTAEKVQKSIKATTNRLQKQTSNIDLRCQFNFTIPIDINTTHMIQQFPNQITTIGRIKRSYCFSICICVMIHPIRNGLTFTEAVSKCQLVRIKNWGWETGRKRAWSSCWMQNRRLNIFKTTLEFRISSNHFSPKMLPKRGLKAPFFKLIHIIRKQTDWASKFWWITERKIHRACCDGF